MNNPQEVASRLAELNSLAALNDVIMDCRLCPRLVTWREEVARVKRRSFRDWDYWGRPVPGFGDPTARILIVGLAPAAHGGNRTGRVFTGDSSGNFLYAALYRAGFASQPTSERRGDGLELCDVYVAATCRCAPPDNKPTREEILNCRPYLITELRLLEHLQGIVVLGKIAFDDVLALYRVLGHEPGRLKFGHNVLNSIGDGLPWLLSSYHPSQQNTQTGRLTEAMFDDVWQQARTLLE